MGSHVNYHQQEAVRMSGNTNRQQQLLGVIKTVQRVLHSDALHMRVTSTHTLEKVFGEVALGSDIHLSG